MVVGWIIQYILINYWFAIKKLSGIANIYSEQSGEQWLIDLCQGLRNLCELHLLPAFSGIGLAVAMTYFLISIIGLVTEDRFTPEFLVKFFAKLVISVAVILFSQDLLFGIIDFGDALGNTFQDWRADDFIASTTLEGESSGSTTSKNKDKNKDEGGATGATFKTFATSFINAVELDTGYKVDGGAETSIGYIPEEDNYYFAFEWVKNEDDDEPLNFIQQLIMALPLLLSSSLLLLLSNLAIPAVTAAILFIEVSRVVELYIRGSLLPIAAGVMADDGWRGAGGRYFKKVLALASQKLVLSLSCVMTGAITTQYLMTSLTKASNYAGNTTVDFMGESFNVLLTAVVIALAGVSFMFKSLQVVNDLWGAS